MSDRRLSAGHAEARLRQRLFLIVGARRIWRGGHRYSKAGLITVDLVSLADSQRALPGMDLGDREMSADLMAALDAYNRRFGRGAVVPGAAGFAPRRA